MSSSAPAPLRVRHLLLIVLPLAAALTATATTQEIVRSRMTGTGAGLLPVLEFNVVDWVLWSMLSIVMLPLARRWSVLDTARRARAVAVWCGAVLVLSVVHSLLAGSIGAMLGLLPRGFQGASFARVAPMWVVATLPLNLLIGTMLAGLVHAATAQRDIRMRRDREKELELHLSEARLDLLRMQLQPHFFFNTLNTISSLMLTDVATAQRVTADLGDLVRASIDHTAMQEVSLREELAFVTRYIHIQKARFRGRLDTQIGVPDDLLSARVPSLLLQPLVENAIRHGVERRAAGGSVRIDATRADGHLQLSVENDLGDGAPVQSERRGIGLANIRARLSQLYGDDHQFHSGVTERALSRRDRAALQAREPPMNAMTLTAAIVDDEEPARELIRALLGEWPQIRVVGEAGDGAGALELVRTLSPALVFLDVQLPDMNGVEVVRRIDPRAMPHVVFVTAYDRYAVQAFDVSACDYLLKPVAADRMAAAVQRVLARVNDPRSAALDAIQRLVQQHLEPPRQELVVKVEGSHLFLDAREIEWIEAKGKDVRLHLLGSGQSDRTRIVDVREPMASLERRLDSAAFIRVHRSAIVNRRQIREIQPWFRGDFVVVLRRGTRVVSGRTFRASIQALVSGDTK